MPAARPQPYQGGLQASATAGGPSPHSFPRLAPLPRTLLLSQGVHPKVVQERLGHSAIGVTLDTYSHVLPGMQEQAVTDLQARLFGSRMRKVPV